MKIELVAIGTVKNNYKALKDCPPNGWGSDINSQIHIHKEYIDGLTGLFEGEVIHVLWWCDRAPRDILKNRVGKDEFETGVFAMRSPHRPNPIALSLCRIISINDNVLTVCGLESLDGSIVLDIKRAIWYDGVWL